MFTGIVQSLGKLVALNKKASPELIVDTKLERDIRIGDSVAVNGACLTVVKIKNSEYTFNLSRETLALSHFGDLVRGSVVNIELPLSLNDLVSGHLVSGHLDGTVRARSLGRSPEHSAFAFTFSRREWRPFLVLKGSVALNGISLTLAEVRDSSFSVEIIPHTLETTNLRFLKVGDRVNLELDLIGKYIYNQRYLMGKK
jgi:riboflavin synthase